ncbi:hypothetical protein FLACOL_00719 [Flavobacterium columnare]|uniref:Uncharacterized protein n=2 Tax=Flavobacterium TaxID=237 RepID=A0ABW8PTC9_9FLAO|nr:hypothetical protein [Flavobacterium columnare]SPE76730.1 hypothetical protein FLACOL_00719 [Flavobacterium columnare]
MCAGLVQNPDHDHLGHAYTKLRGYVWNWFEDLEKIAFTFNRSETKYQRLPSDGLGPATTIKLQLKIYSSHSNKYNTQFIKVYKNGKYYHFHSNNEYEG